MTVQINRDPFARQDTIRRVRETVSPTGCDWCGNQRPRGRLFEYGTETDGGRTHWHRGAFCSKSCHDSFHS